MQRRLGARGLGVASRMVGRIKVENLAHAQEAKAVGLLDGTRTPAEIAAAQPADAGVVLPLALLLGDLDLLTFGPPRPSAAPAASPPASVTPPSPPPSVTSCTTFACARSRRVAACSGAAGGCRTHTLARRCGCSAAPSAACTPPGGPPAGDPAPGGAPVQIAAALDAASLRAMLEKHKEEDHFQVLGVKRDASLAAVKAAYFQLARSYHPDAVPADATPEVRDLCADVFARLSEAWAVLGDEARRAKYVEELQSGGAADVDVMRSFTPRTCSRMRPRW